LSQITQNTGNNDNNKDKNRGERFLSSTSKRTETHNSNRVDNLRQNKKKRDQRNSEVKLKIKQKTQKNK